MATGGDEKHDNKFIQINIYRLKHFFAPMHTEHVRQKHKKWAKLSLSTKGCNGSPPGVANRRGGVKKGRLLMADGWFPLKVTLYKHVVQCWGRSFTVQV